MDPLQAKALEIHRQLYASYDAPIAYFDSLDSLSDLVGSFLLHRTRNADSGAVYRSLRERFPDGAPA